MLCLFLFYPTKCTKLLAEGQLVVLLLDKQVSFSYQLFSRQCHTFCLLTNVFLPSAKPFAGFYKCSGGIPGSFISVAKCLVASPECFGGIPERNISWRKPLGEIPGYFAPFCKCFGGTPERFTLGW